MMKYFGERGPLTGDASIWCDKDRKPRVTIKISRYADGWYTLEQRSESGRLMGSVYGNPQSDYADTLNRFVDTAKSCGYEVEVAQ